ncbi:MAG: serine/threonine-protein kinase [Gemmatimonadaceae bacterium]
MMRCPVCSATYGADARFCTRDGARLVEVAHSPPSAPRSNPSAALPRFDPRSATFVTPPEPVREGPPGSPVAPPRPEPPRPEPARREPPSASSGDAAPQADPGARRGSATSHAHLAGQLLDGRYRIERKVGEGGMSFVYLAHEEGTGARLAIKVLSPQLSQEQNAMARLRREAGLGSRLAHPNVCHIVRLGETPDGLVYVVMPFVEGELLADRTHRLGHVPLAQVVQWVREIAAGLHVAHELRIVHRDLKPENVMVCARPDGTEYAVVMDFGLAKERIVGPEIEKLTATGIVLGTPEFMSPEQLRGRPLDARTDIYSLALVTYEMLTGKLPFEGRTQQETMIARLRSDPVPLRRMRPELDFPAPLERVLLRALEREPERRYQSAPDFAHAFAEAAEGREMAPPPPAPGFLGRLFGR